MTNGTDSERELPIASVDGMAKRGLGDRIFDLREALKWTQSELLANAARQRHKLERPELSKVENNRNLLKSDRLRKSVAAGLLLTPTELDAYLADKMTIDEVVALVKPRSAAVASPASHSGGVEASAVRTGDEMGVMLALKAVREGSTTYPKLTLAVAYWADNGKHWSRPTIAAAEAGYFARERCEEWTSAQWVRALDGLEAQLATRPTIMPAKQS